MDSVFCCVRPQELVSLGSLTRSGRGWCAHRQFFGRSLGKTGEWMPATALPPIAKRTYSQGGLVPLNILVLTVLDPFL